MDGCSGSSTLIFDSRKAPNTRQLQFSPRRLHPVHVGFASSPGCYSAWTVRPGRSRVHTFPPASTAVQASRAGALPGLCRTHCYCLLQVSKLRLIDRAKRSKNKPEREIEEKGESVIASKGNIKRRGGLPHEATWRNLEMTGISDGEIDIYTRTITCACPKEKRGSIRRRKRE